MKKIKELLYYNKKIFFSFCILIISTVCLSFFLLLYVQFQKVAYKTISSYTSEYLKRIDTISFSLLNNIKESAMQMFYTSSIKHLRLKDNLTTAERITGLRDLGNFVSSSDMLDSIIIYNSHLNMLFSSSNKYSCTKITDFPDKQAIDILTNPQNYPYLSPIKRSTKSNSCYSFLFYENQSSSHSALLVNIKASWYESQLWGISQEDNYVIVDSEGNNVISNNIVLPAHIRTYLLGIEKENKKDGFIMPDIFSVQPGYIYYKIRNSDWYYVKPINLNTIVPGLITIRNFLFISFSIISILMIFFILYILIKVYFPFHYIKAALISYSEGSKNTNTSIEYLVDQFQETCYIQSISQLHSGILPFGFSFPVLMIIAEHHDMESLRTILKKYFDNVLIAKNDKIITSGIHSCTKAQFETFLYSVKEHCPYKLYVSNLCFSSEDLIRSNESLVELRQLSFLYPKNLIMPQSLLEQCHYISGFNTKDVSSLISALKAGHFEEAWGYWNSIFSSICQDRYSDFLFAIHYLNKEITNLESELYLKQHLDISSILENLTDASCLHQHMKERFLLITKASISKKKEYLASLSNQIDQYIYKHYKEDTFSTQQVAETFQMNSAYLTRQYRQSSGISINDAIHKIRITQACILLSNTNESIEIIANHVGYSNTKYFFVIFKKWTGLTPKQFKTSKCSEDK